MKEQVARYTVSMNKQLLNKFDKHIINKGYENRSEAIRDLIRSSLVEEEWVEDNEKVASTVTLVYDHHTLDLSKRLMSLQHHHSDIIVTTTHVHLDNHNCLEVIILRGKCKDVRKLSEQLVAVKGIKHGKIAFTTEGRDLW